MILTLILYVWNKMKVDPSSAIGLRITTAITGILYDLVLIGLLLKVLF